MSRSGDSAILDKLQDTHLDFSPDAELVVEIRPLQVRASGLTDAGKVRAVNEDRFLITEFPWRTGAQPESHSGSHVHLLAVADGMGGHAGGQRASGLALETLQEYLRGVFRNGRDHWGNGTEKILAGLRAAAAAAHAEVRSQARQYPQFHGMGSTLTAACLWQRELSIAQVGDSRCYLIRNGTLRGLTTDQTMIAELLRAGVLTAADAARHPWRHVITNAIGGTEAGSPPELQTVTVQPGDLVLLCSDGLTEMVSEEEILEEARVSSEPEALCRRLINRANEQGGRDNITAVVAQLLVPGA
jgi:protein phosphatase